MIGNHIAELNEITRPMGIEVTRLFQGELGWKVYFKNNGHASIWEAPMVWGPLKLKARFLQFLLGER